MVKGKPFEVSKEVYDRAVARCKDKNRESFPMADEDKEREFSDAIIWGYGLYSCMVHEEDGKYICTWCRGDSCE